MNAMKFRYRCNDCPKKLIPELFHIIDNAREITYETFRRRVGIKEIKWWEEAYGYRSPLRLGNDYCVSFHRSRTPDKRPVYFFIWSAIEHVYYPDHDDPCPYCNQAECVCPTCKVCGVNRRAYDECYCN